MVVVEGGNVLHHLKSEGELSGRGKCPGYMYGGNISTAECSDPNHSSVRYKLMNAIF